jgi:uncharacterized protein (DUF924 family)
MDHRISRGAASREGFVEQEFHAGRDLGSGNAMTVSTRPSDVLAFWREAGPSLWFTKDAEFDRCLRETFLNAHEAASRGDLDDWQRTAEGTLALILLLDQFPRNAFRGTARMYASDAKAKQIATTAIAAGHDRQIENELRTFLYMPFAHSEMLEDQERSVMLFRELDEQDLAHAQHHHDIIKRFGRFPHRNVILGREMTEEEREFLDQGGFAG